MIACRLGREEASPERRISLRRSARRLLRRRVRSTSLTDRQGRPRPGSRCQRLSLSLSSSTFLFLFLFLPFSFVALALSPFSSLSPLSLNFLLHNHRLGWSDEREHARDGYYNNRCTRFPLKAATRRDRRGIVSRRAEARGFPFFRRKLVLRYRRRRRGYLRSKPAVHPRKASPFLPPLPLRHH